jgi:hypothetical protein
MISFLSGAVSFAKAVPYLAQLVEEFYKLWVNYKIDQIEKEFNDIAKKRIAVYNAISKAENDSDRKALSIILADLHR